MRISTNMDDAGYDPLSYKYRAYLDGKELDLCFIADEEKGEAHCYVKGEDGRIIRASCMDKAKTVILYGKVEIKRLSDFDVAKNRIKQRGGVSMIFKRSIKKFFRYYWPNVFIVCILIATSGASIFMDRLINA